MSYSCHVCGTTIMEDDISLCGSCKGNNVWEKFQKMAELFNKENQQDAIIYYKDNISSMGVFGLDGFVSLLELDIQNIQDNKNDLEDIWLNVILNWIPGMGLRQTKKFFIFVDLLNSID